MIADRIRADAWVIADVAAVIVFRIRVEDFLVETFLRNTDAVVLPDHGRKVADDDKLVFRVGGASDKADDRSVSVADVDPVEALPTAIHFAECSFREIEMIQIIFAEATEGGDICCFEAFLAS